VVMTDSLQRSTSCLVLGCDAVSCSDCAGKTNIDMGASVLNVRQTLVRVKNHTAPDNKHKTTLLFQDPKTAYSRRTVPIPAECLATLKRHKARQAEEKLLLGQAYEDHGLVFCRPAGNPH